jgi:mono/diheme cytochrome c family protein
MKILTYTQLITMMALLLMACSSKNQSEPRNESITMTNESTEKVSEDGIGPIKDLTLPDELNELMAMKGEEIFTSKCSACHKVEKRYIGPSPKNILDRRTPAWVMNMILNPEQMVKEDPIAKQLLMEYNGTPMANQNLTEEEARAVLEYFRTL